MNVFFGIICSFSGGEIWESQARFLKEVVMIFRDTKYVFFREFYRKQT